MVKDFSVTNNQTTANRAIDYYINTILPALKDIQELKYKESIVENIENDHTKMTTHYLIQRKNKLSDLEFYTEGNDKVLNYEINGKQKKGEIPVGQTENIVGNNADNDSSSDIENESVEETESVEENESEEENESVNNSEVEEEEP